MEVLEAIRSQIDSARMDLEQYRPVTLDWHRRAIATAEWVVPWLTTVAPALRHHVQDVLNAPQLLRTLWAELRTRVQASSAEVEAFDRQLELDSVLRESVTGEVVSSIVARFLVAHAPADSFRTNGRSDYPDLYDARLDYAALPSFARKRKAALDDEYGAAVKGPERRPVRVPDGLEIKTCRRRIAVDCHHPHAGLHLAVVFVEAERLFAVTDVRLAFLRAADYRESERNTTATTVKYSFGGDRFVSLLVTT